MKPDPIYTRSVSLSGYAKFIKLHGGKMVYPIALLDYKLKGKLKRLKPLVNIYLKNRMANLPVYDATIATNVALAIPGILGTDNCNIEIVARALDLHPKKLQRLLAAGNTNFSAQLDHVRETMAKDLLYKSDAPISRIAGFLSYSETAPFSSACKRWTGLSHVQYRKQIRKNPQP